MWLFRFPEHKLQIIRNKNNKRLLQEQRLLEMVTPGIPQQILQPLPPLPQQLQPPPPIAAAAVVQPPILSLIPPLQPPLQQQLQPPAPPFLSMPRPYHNITEQHPLQSNNDVLITTILRLTVILLYLCI